MDNNASKKTKQKLPYRISDYIATNRDIDMKVPCKGCTFREIEYVMLHANIECIGSTKRK